MKALDADEGGEKIAEDKQYADAVSVQLCHRPLFVLFTTESQLSDVIRMVSRMLSILISPQRFHLDHFLSGTISSGFRLFLFSLGSS